MGQQTSTSLQEFASNAFLKILFDDPSLSAMTEDMSYEDFKDRLNKLNKLSETCLDSSGKQLMFAIKKGTNNTFFWKATVQIACVKIDPVTHKVYSYRLVNLKQFLQIFSTLELQNSAAIQSIATGKKTSSSSENLRELQESTTEEPSECCICLERKIDILLPCTHSYCLKCIEQWNADHHNCPICRENLESTDESWVLSEIPKAEEISESIKKTLMNLDKQKDNVKCT